MVGPIRNQSAHFFKLPSKKKSTKEIDSRVKKVVKKPKPPASIKAKGSIKASSKIATEKALLAAEKAASAAGQRAFETKRAALLAQKKAFLAQRAHMAQQAAAARRARAAEKAKRAATRAAKKASALRKLAKIKAYLARPEEKKRSKLLKKYLPIKKKKNPKDEQDPLQ
jgi:colicin import membrane protein